MHKLSDVVHVDLDVFGPLSLNQICRDIDSSLIVTKNDSRSDVTNVKLN